MPYHRWHSHRATIALLLGGVGTSALLLKPTRQPAEEERVEVRFTMREGETEVECLIDESAVDDLDDPEDDTLVDRYARHRAVFEAIASWLFDEREVPRVELHRVVQFRERAVP